MLAILKRELKSYLTSMIGWVFMACITVFIGIYFYMYNLYYGYPYLSYSLNGTLFIFMLVIPILTMRSFAEERRSKTDQFLLTAPVSLTNIVLGKFLAMAIIFAIVCLVSCICPIVIKSYGTAYFLTDYMSIFMYFLLGCSYIAIGMFLSSLTESQIIAAVASYAVFILLYLMNGLVAAIPSVDYVSLIGFAAIILIIAFIYWVLTKNLLVSFIVTLAGLVALCVIYWFFPTYFENALPELLNSLSLTAGFQETASYSVLTLGSVVKYASVIFFFCFLTVQSIQKRRWS